MKTRGFTLASRRGEDGRCRSDEEDEEADARPRVGGGEIPRGATVSSRALDARALRRVARALEAKMRERDARWEACDAREREVAAAQAPRRTTRFEAFVRENEVKRHVAMRREKEEREANARRDERLVEMRETLRERSEAAARVERELVRVRALETLLTRRRRESAAATRSRISRTSSRGTRRFARRVMDCERAWRRVRNAPRRVERRTSAR